MTEEELGKYLKDKLRLGYMAPNDGRDYLTLEFDGEVISRIPI